MRGKFPSRRPPAASGKSASLSLLSPPPSVRPNERKPSNLPRRISRLRRRRRSTLTTTTMTKGRFRDQIWAIQRRGVKAERGESKGGREGAGCSGGLMIETFIVLARWAICDASGAPVIDSLTHSTHSPHNRLSEQLCLAFIIGIFGRDIVVYLLK